MRNIKMLREKAGFSQRGLAQHLGMSFPSIQKIECKEDSDPKWSTVVALADCFGVATDYLMGRGTEATRFVDMHQGEFTEEELILAMEFIRNLRKTRTP